MNRTTLAVAVLASMLASPAYAERCDPSPISAKFEQLDLARVHDSAASVRRTWVEIAKLATEVCRFQRGRHLSGQFAAPEPSSFHMLASEYTRRLIDFVEKHYCKGDKCFNVSAKSFDWAAERALEIIKKVEHREMAELIERDRLYQESRVGRIRAELKGSK